MIFKRGDRVRVRPWEEMRKDDRVYRDGDGDLTEKKRIWIFYTYAQGIDRPIRADTGAEQNPKVRPYTFTGYMKRFCGKTARIEYSNDDMEYLLSFEDEEGICQFVFREWMLEEA